MQRFSARIFCVLLAFLLLLFAVAFYAVACMPSASLHIGFVEAAVRADRMLSILSALLVVAISIFVAYAAYRHRQNRANG